jgi:deoxyuridine 5'-triphosphate nucleotidohydrolase
MHPIRSLDSSEVDDSANPELRRLSFKRLNPGATLPTRGSSQAAGLDIFSIDEVVIEPKQRSLVRTGLAVAIPEGHYGRIAPRSGLATQKGLDVLAGVIDSDYRGEVRCLLYNAGEEPIHLPTQSKICQLIIEKIITPSAVWADEITETDRGSGGFGSTG